MLTGRDADIAIIDDPLKPEEALSVGPAPGGQRLVRPHLLHRLNDTRSGSIILIMHRPHEVDLAGHVLTHEDWDVVRFSGNRRGG